MSEGRKIPQAEEAERAVLGAFVLEAESMVPLARLTMGLKPDCFYHPLIRRAVESVFDMFDARQPVDILTICQKLGDDDSRSLIMQAVDSTPTTANAQFYMELVRGKHMARETIRLAREIEDEAFTTETPDGLLAKAPQMFVEVLSGVPKQHITNEQRLDRSVAMWRELKARRERGEFNVLRGHPTPFPCMDKWTSGWTPGLIMLAGRPSAGKTTLEDHIVVKMCQEGLPVARVALDMSPDIVLERTACRKAQVSFPKLNKGYATNRQIEQVEEAKEIIKGYPMFINHLDRDVRSVCTWARNLHRREGIKMLTVDFVQLLNYENPGKFLDRNSEVAKISGMLKSLALELNIPVILLSQMSRSSEKENRRPQLSDLRDSGTLEQDASVVLFVYKDAKNPETDIMIEEKHPAKRRNVWVDCLKNQNGETTRQPFYFYAHYFLFEEAGVKDFGTGGEE
jgi:replicative DNA helicase